MNLSVLYQYHATYYSYFVVQFEVSDGDAYRSPFIAQDSFNYAEFFVFIYEVGNCFLKVCK